MKKVLSVLLAAAMVAGMSVASMAKPGTATTEKDVTNVTASVKKDADLFNLANVAVQRGSKFLATDGSTLLDYSTSNGTSPWFKANELKGLKAGDILYFEGHFSALGSIPSNWKIMLKADANVESASFVVADGTDTGADTPLNNMLYWTRTKVDEKEVYLKVVLADEAADKAVDFNIQVVSTDASYKDSGKYDVEYNFATTTTKEVDVTALDLDYIYDVTKTDVKYEYVGPKGKVATINFNDVAYGEFKMWPEEVYTLSASEKYNKTLTKEYDTEVVVKSFNLTNAENVDLFFPMSKDAYQVVAVVDGELVPVEAEYIEDYKFNNGTKATGYLVEDAEYTAYAVIDASVEVAVEEEVVEAPAETEKANPETGASDFVGAAVALAVVSVAAAGALALKK